MKPWFLATSLLQDPIRKLLLLFADRPSLALALTDLVGEEPVTFLECLGHWLRLLLLLLLSFSQDTNVQCLLLRHICL